jgi:hypothetical protein
MSEHVATAVSGSSSEHLGVDLGVGVMAVSREELGIRADVRYFQDLVGNSSTSGIDFGSFHFWRASLSVVIAF